MLKSKILPCANVPLYTVIQTSDECKENCELGNIVLMYREVPTINI